jgi:hypothetical protein
LIAARRAELRARNGRRQRCGVRFGLCGGCVLMFGFNGSWARRWRRSGRTETAGAESMAAHTFGKSLAAEIGPLGRARKGAWRIDARDADGRRLRGVRNWGFGGRPWFGGRGEVFGQFRRDRFSGDIFGEHF